LDGKVIVDTTFLIDLEREISRRQPGLAMEFLARNHAQTMRISVVTLGELAEGCEDPAAPGLEELVAPYGIIEITRAIGVKYAAISRGLRKEPLGRQRSLDRGHTARCNPKAVSAAARNAMRYGLLPQPGVRKPLLPNNIWKNTVIAIFNLPLLNFLAIFQP
jgi:predicted nucleic acid-binding protein